MNSILSGSRAQNQTIAMYLGTGPILLLKMLLLTANEKEIEKEVQTSDKNITPKYYFEGNFVDIFQMKYLEKLFYCTYIYNRY